MLFCTGLIHTVPYHIVLSRSTLLDEAQTLQPSPLRGSATRRPGFSSSAASPVLLCTILPYCTVRFCNFELRADRHPTPRSAHLSMATARAALASPAARLALYCSVPYYHAVPYDFVTFVTAR